jgi:hypothetical protein
MGDVLVGGGVRGGHDEPAADEDGLVGWLVVVGMRGDADGVG